MCFLLTQIAFNCSDVVPEQSTANIHTFSMDMLFRGKDYKLSRERIRQIEAKGLKRLTKSKKLKEFL